MPSKLRRLSGADVVAILRRFDFEQVTQRGSHVKLRRTTPQGLRQTLHIPLHRELRTGTLLAIYRQACEYVPEADLRPHFFTE
ncbi:MAG: hypothetical protein AMXMBFR47_40560 [Planctomycetota bacterium]